MSKLLVNVFCPPVSKSYDFWIPDKMKVETVIQLMCDDITQMENGKLFPSRDTLLLYSYLGEKVLARELTLAECGVKSGDRLALI